MASFAALEDKSGRLSDLQGEFRREFFIGFASDAVGSKIGSGHLAAVPRFKNAQNGGKRAEEVDADLAIFRSGRGAIF
jgi:hypothetical protein